MRSPHHVYGRCTQRARDPAVSLALMAPVRNANERAALAPRHCSGGNDGRRSDSPKPQAEAQQAGLANAGTRGGASKPSAWRRPTPPQGNRANVRQNTTTAGDTAARSSHGRECRCVDPRRPLPSQQRRLGNGEGRPCDFPCTPPHHRGRCVAAAALAVVPAFAQSAAQWPDRPVRLLVPVGAGGAADSLSRNLSNGFQQFANGQPLIVENRVGAGGTLAAAAVAREKPDGYTLFLAEVGPNAVSHTLGKLPYDPHTAFTPIIHVGQSAGGRADPADAALHDAGRISLPRRNSSRASSTTPRRGSATGRICSWPISTARPGSTWSTSSTARAPRC